MQALKYLMVAICIFLYCPEVKAQAVEEGGITIAWTGNTESDLDGYKVYYGSESGLYDVTLDIKNITQYTIRKLKPGEKYYIAITAYDTWGNESGYSSEVTTTAKDIIFPKPPKNVREATTVVKPAS